MAMRGSPGVRAPGERRVAARGLREAGDVVRRSATVYPLAVKKWPSTNSSMAS
jgi:hypothetical protein